jgi:regulator of replication initiation timing
MSDNTLTKENLDQCVRAVVDSAMVKWYEKLDKLEGEIASLKEEVAVLKAENIDLKDKMDLSNEATDQMNKIATVQAIHNIDSDVYNRKWNLVIQGIEGPAGETEEVTTQKVRKMAEEKLKIAAAADPMKMPFAACHRLSQKANAGIIIRFTNLTDRNQWFSNARELKDNATKITISPDIPPILKPLKADIMKHRMNHPDKKHCKVKYSKSWPYISLFRPSGDLYRPKIHLSDIVQKYLPPTCPGFRPRAFY